MDFKKEEIVEEIFSKKDAFYFTSSFFAEAEGPETASGGSLALRREGLIFR